MENARTLKLYELGDQLEALVEQIVEQGGDITAEQQAQLDQLEREFVRKVERVALYYRNLVVLADAARAEAERLDRIARARTRAAESLRRYLHGELIRAGMDSVVTPLVRVRRQRNSLPKVIVEIAAEELPEAFQVIRREPNRKVLLDLWRAGGCLPAGVRVEYDEHLKIE